MHAASREALLRVYPTVDQLSSDAQQAPAAAQLGIDLFDVVDFLDTNRSLRTAIVHASRTAEERQGIIRELFSSRISEPALQVLLEAVGQRWSTPREFRAGVVELGRRALLRAAEAEGQLEAVETQLFELSRILEKQGELTMLLSDTTASAAAHRSLMASVLYGKVLSYTEALALQVIGRPENNPVDDLVGLANRAASLRDRQVAHVVSAVALQPEQESALESKLGKLFGAEVSVHSEVNEDLLGGMTVRVGSEKIDGSTRGRLNRLKAQFA